MMLNQERIRHNIIYSCYLVNIYIKNDICYFFDEEEEEEEIELSFVPKTKIILPSFIRNEEKTISFIINNNNNKEESIEIVENNRIETEFQKMMKKMLLEELEEVNLYE